MHCSLKRGESKIHLYIQCNPHSQELLTGWCVSYTKQGMLFLLTTRQQEVCITLVLFFFFLPGLLCNICVFIHCSRHLSHPSLSHVSPLWSSSMSVSRLEPELQEKIRASHPGVERVYFNKGLWVSSPLIQTLPYVAAGSTLASLPALLIQCAKVKFASPHIPGSPPSVFL